MDKERKNSYSHRRERHREHHRSNRRRSSSDSRSSEESRNHRHKRSRSRSRSREGHHSRHYSRNSPGIIRDYRKKSSVLDNESEKKYKDIHERSETSSPSRNDHEKRENHESIHFDRTSIYHKNKGARKTSGSGSASPSKNRSSSFCISDFSQPSSSLMVRGSIIPSTDETILLDVFGKFAQVKDIRMIKDRNTKEFKDFAFIEFFSQQDANIISRVNPISVLGIPVHVTYSKNKRGEVPAMEVPYFNPFLAPMVYSQEFGQGIFAQPVAESIPAANSAQEQKEPKKVESVTTKAPASEMEKMQARLKQWQKEQEKIERVNRELGKIDRNLEIMPEISIDNPASSQSSSSKLYICIPCKRKFKSKELLQFHFDNSLLHQNNTRLATGTINL